MAESPLEYLIPGKIRRKMQASKLDDTIQGKIIAERTGLKPSEYDSVADAYSALAAVQGIEKSALTSAVESAKAPAEISKGSIESRIADLAVSLLEDNRKKQNAIPTPEDTMNKLNALQQRAATPPVTGLSKTTTPTGAAPASTPKILNTISPGQLTGTGKVPLESADYPQIATGQKVYLDEEGKTKITKSPVQREEELITKNIEAMSEVEKKKATELLSAQNQAKGTYRFMQQFAKSWDELKKWDKDIDKEGFDGWSKRQISKFASGFDELPETKALMIQIKPMANQMARDIEGGRVTDNDRKIYADAFAAGYSNPTRTNVRLMANALITIIDRNNYDSRFSETMSAHLKQLVHMNHPLLNKVVEQILTEYPDMVKSVYGNDYEVIDAD